MLACFQNVLFLFLKPLISGLPGISHNREGIFKNKDAIKWFKIVWSKKSKDWTTSTTTMREQLLIASSDFEGKKRLKIPKELLHVKPLLNEISKGACRTCPAKEACFHSRKFRVF